MTESFESVIGPRINNILAVSAFMKERITERYDDPEGKAASPYDVPDDYSFGWKSIIEFTVSNCSINGLLISGADGCGKHTAADIACSVLLGEREYELAYLNSEDFVFSEAELKADDSDRQRKIEKGDTKTYTDDTIHSFFECLFSMFEEDLPYCLVIDNTDGFEKIKSVYSRLGKYICIGEPNVFVIVIERNENAVPSVLRNQLRLMRMTAPNRRQRISMIDNALKKTQVIDRETVEIISDATEDLTYSQLKDLVCNLSMYVLGDVNFSIEGINEMVSSQYHLISDGDGIQDEKIRLYRKIEELIDMAPELIEKMPAASFAAVRTAETENKTEDMASLEEKDAAIDAEAVREQNKIKYESERMPMQDLLGSYLGEERMAKVRNAMPA